MKKRTVAILLTGALVFSVLPSNVKAEEAYVQELSVGDEGVSEEEVPEEELFEENAISEEDIHETEELLLEETVEEPKKALGLSGNEFVELPDGYVTDSNAKMAMGTDSRQSWAVPPSMVGQYVLNVLGKIGDKWYKTTYSNSGFNAIVQVLENGQAVYANTVDPSKGEYNLYGDIYVSYYGKIINGGSYVQLNTTVQNKGDQDAVVNVGGNSDIQICADDHAPMEVLEGGSGVRMWSSKNTEQQFNFYCRNVNGTTNVDTFWMGKYTDTYKNMLVQTDKTSLSGVDSGISYSWQNRTIKPGEKRTYSVIVGLGKINAAPVITENKKLFDAQGEQADEFAAGDKGQMRVTVKDEDNLPEELQMYFALDNGEFEAVEAAFDTEGNFAVDFELPAELESGDHTIKVYAQDPAGGISSVAEAAFMVAEVPEIIKHTVTFVDGDGKVITILEVADQEGAAAPEAPLKTGYDFTGWDKDFSKVTEDMTVTAQYAVKTFTVTFMYDKDKVIGKPQTVPYMGAAKAPEVPVKEGYRFVKWDKSFDQVTGDLVVNAVYEEIKAPKTGDDAHSLLYALMLLGSFVFGTVALKKRRIE